VVISLECAIISVTSPRVPRPTWANDATDRRDYQLRFISRILAPTLQYSATYWTTREITSHTSSSRSYSIFNLRSHNSACWETTSMARFKMVDDVPYSRLHQKLTGTAVSQNLAVVFLSWWSTSVGIPSCPRPNLEGDTGEPPKLIPPNFLGRVLYWGTASLGRKLGRNTTGYHQRVDQPRSISAIAPHEEMFRMRHSHYICFSILRHIYCPT